jgi:hypothetical protein
LRDDKSIENLSEDLEGKRPLGIPGRGWVNSAKTGIKRPGLETESSPYSADVKNAWSFASVSPYVIITQWGNFTYIHRTLQQ